MLKTILRGIVISVIYSSNCIAQCTTALSPPVCLGTEPLVLNNEIINQGTTKWYYGGASTLNSLTLNGGTLVVSGDLTVDKFYMDSGTIYIHPGARFVIGSGIGAGLVLKGNSAIYNFGRCEVQRNLSLDNGYATPAKPNIVINATSSSIFRMPNQYFVINNPYSWFVNKGTAEFWGIITDPLSSPGSVCLGSASSTRMAVLINKVLNSYSVPVGTACLNVYQYSQFYNKLTSNNGLLVCLGSGHSSDAGCIPFGCQPNNWGTTQVFTNCSGCSSFVTLYQGGFKSFTAEALSNATNQLKWEFNNDGREGLFRIERSADGMSYQTIDSIPGKDQGTSFQMVDKKPLTSNNYYMIRYIQQRTGSILNSRIVKVDAQPLESLAIYPVPFLDRLFINYEPGFYPEKIMMTDITGRNIKTQRITMGNARQIEITVLDPIERGIYIIHIRTEKNTISKTVIRR